MGGNVSLLVLHLPPTPWLIALVDLGPVAGVFLANVATAINYYGTWRILRGLDAYDVRDDARDQLLGVPDMLQDAPSWLAARLGCARAGANLAAVGLLALALVLTGLTLAPPPYQVLGVAVDAAGGTSALPAPTPDAVPLTPTPTEPPLLRLVASPLVVTQRCNGNKALAPLTVTLDNTASTAPIDWTVTISETIPSGFPPWADALPARGTVPAGATATFVLQPSPSLCSATPPAGQTFHVTLALSGGSPRAYTLADTVLPYAPTPTPTSTPTPTPTAMPTPTSALAPQLSVSPTGTTTVNCGLAQPYPTITVRNTGGQPLNWQASATNGQVTLSPSSGSVAGGQSQTVTLTQTGASPGTDVHVTSNGGSATVSFVCPIG